MSVSWRNIGRLFRCNRLFLTRSPATMQTDKNSNNKRPLEEKNESTAKKPATRQASLLSMFKPKVVEKDVQALGVKTSSRKPIDLLPDISDEMKELLDLELTTMQYDWFKALKPEFTKPYFIEVRPPHP